MKTQHPLLGLTRHSPFGEDASESPKKFRRLVKPSKHHRLNTAGLIQDTPQRKQAAQASTLEHGGSHQRHLHEAFNSQGCGRVGRKFDPPTGKKKSPRKTLRKHHHFHIPKNPIIRELKGGNSPASIKHRLDSFVTALTSTHSRWPKVPGAETIILQSRRAVVDGWSDD